MNMFARQNEGQKATWGLRLSSLAVAGIALGALQGPMGSAVAADDPGSVRIVQHAQNAWSSGTLGMLDEIVVYQDVDLPLTVSVDWGDGTVDTGLFDGTQNAPEDELLAMYPAQQSETNLPGDEMDLFAGHTYTDPGDYEPTITVVDSQGERAQAVRSLDVEGVTAVDPGEDPVEQDVTFQKLGDRTYGDDFYVRATGGGSGNPVTVSTTTPDVCQAGGTNGMRIHLVRVGTCIVTANQAGGAGYLDGSWYDGFNVEPAPLRIIAQDKQSTSFETDPSWTFSYQGLVNGESPSVVSGLSTQILDTGNRVGLHSSPGTYTIRPVGAQAANYDVKLVDGTLTVNPSVKVGAAGLPADLTGRVAKVNGQKVTVPYVGTVALGSQLSVELAPLALDVPSGELFVTTTRGRTVQSLRDNVGLDARYRTIPALIDAAALSSRPDVPTLLKAQWEQAQHALVWTGTGGLDRLHALADRIEVSSGGTIDAAKATVLLQHLQVVYATYGGRGQV